jgi:hypothetical protein
MVRAACDLNFVQFLCPETLDSVNLVEQMIHNGEQKGAETYQMLAPKYFSHKAPSYRPFESTHGSTAPEPNTIG